MDDGVTWHVVDGKRVARVLAGLRVDYMTNGLVYFPEQDVQEGRCPRGRREVRLSDLALHHLKMMHPDVRPAVDGLLTEAVRCERAWEWFLATLNHVGERRGLRFVPGEDGYLVEEPLDGDGGRA